LVGWQGGLTNFLAAPIVDRHAWTGYARLGGNDMDVPRLDPRMPAADDCVLPRILARHAAATPERVFAIFGDGETWSYAQTEAQALRVAAGLAAVGVRQGDTVLLWLPNGRRGLAAWFGTNHLGAVSVAINTAYRGQLLAHVVNNSDARVAVCHEDLVDRLLEEDCRGALTTVFTSAAKVAAEAARFAGFGIRLLPFSALDGDPASVVLPVLQPWDLQSICYTSGTTGPSKGVLSSYLHLHMMGWHCTGGVTADDRYLINLPLFHVGGTLYVTGALARGASIAVMGAFETATFLDVCRALGVTQCLLLGAMVGFLVRKPPAPIDRLHGLRRVAIIPLGEDAAVAAERFGFQEVVTLFNMSEVSAPLCSGPNPTLRGLAGQLRAGMDARIVDENDCELPDGVVGELVLRSDVPWTLSHGYHRNPEATARAWRNGWFHTGDAFRRDAEGNYFFVDRLKDAIRRRGENISSYEVEAAILADPAVLETAAVGVPSELGEEEVLAVVVAKPGQEIDPAAMIQALAGRLPHFMVPRYVRMVPALPKTPTAKVQKQALRAEGLTGETWDREAAGVRLKRERLTD
jgi:crotonobetaine/carnitine-CoA ligase